MNIPNYERLLLLVPNVIKKTVNWNKKKKRKNLTLLSLEYYFSIFSNVGRVSNVNPKSR
jgi:hypothetical protein